MRISPFLFLALLLLPPLGWADDDPKKIPGSAFEFLTGADVKMSIHKAEIKRGFRELGDLRDKLPPIYEPKIVSIEQANRFLQATSRVLGVEIEGEARAYPLLILRIHEIVNDTLGGRPIAPNY